jgi:formylglycine-generating enzyme required for sulfatase activity
VPRGWEYSLPTRAQWEYACRAGSTSLFSFGDSDADLYRYGNYREKSFRKVTPYKDYITDLDHDDKYDLTAPVGSYEPNAWGIYDMHGNVSEWCLDHVQMSDEHRHVPAGAQLTDPFTPASPDRESRNLRGGSWQDWKWDNRCGKGVSMHATTKKDTIGMRVVLVPIRTAAR